MEAFKNIGVQVEKLTVNVTDSTTGFEIVHAANKEIANSSKNLVQLVNEMKMVVSTFKL